MLAGLRAGADNHSLAHVALRLTTSKLTICAVFRKQHRRDSMSFNASSNDYCRNDTSRYSSDAALLIVLAPNAGLGL